jgi:hypothetical protein
MKLIDSRSQAGVNCGRQPASGVRMVGSWAVGSLLAIRWGLLEMKTLLLVAVVSFAPEAFGGAPCAAQFKVPTTWKQGASASTYSLANGAVTMTIECSLLKRTLNDTEFSAHIGEEEPDEAPALKAFGPWRGRIWSMNEEGKELQWWLMKERYLVHFTVRSDARIPEQLENDVTAVIPTLTASKPQPVAPADAAPLRR